MADPIELLESFPRSLSGGAPDPGDLRKRGDQRRTRHRAAGAVAALAAVAAIVAPLALSQDTDSTGEVVSPPEDVVSLAGQIPAQFPLMTGLPLEAAVGLGEKGDKLTLAACGHAAPEPLAVDTKSESGQMGPVNYQRQVLTFEDNAAAQAWVESVRVFFEGCPTETTDGVQVRNVVTAPTEGPQLVVETSANTDEADGVQVDQLYVVGKAVLVAQVQDESAKSGSAPALSDEQVEYAQPVLAAIAHSWVGFGGEQGVFVESATQAASKLDGAPADFQAFVSGLVDELHAREDCSGAAVGVTVHYLVDGKWALGGVNDCGGYVAFWGKGADGQWTELLGGQEAWDCAELEAKAVPEGVAGICFDYKN